jgi:hypothetical protein
MKHVICWLLALVLMIPAFIIGFLYFLWNMELTRKENVRWFKWGCNLLDRKFKYNKLIDYLTENN